MLEFLNLKPDSFGLDISDLSLKIIKLKKNGRFLSLASFGETKIEPGIIKKGQIKNEEALVKIIKKSLNNIRGEELKTKYVITSLPEEKAFLQVIQMPKMEEKELEKAVYFEVENYIPLPIDQVYLDFQIIHFSHNHLPAVHIQDHLDVLIAAIPKKTVIPYVSCFKKAGLILKTLEIESQAISRALIKKEVSPFPVLLIDLGATRTSFIVFSGFSLRFTTSISFSSQELNGAISKILKINLEEAEKLKREYGLKKKNKKANQVLKAMTPLLNDLIKEIKKYLSFYQTHSSHEHLLPDGRAIEKIILSGGLANLKGLTNLLNQKLKIKVEIGNPWINILPKHLKEIPELPYKESLRYNTALGLALRGIKQND